MTTYAWKDRNTLAPSEILYAAGAVVAAWNLCETAMGMMVSHYVHGKPGIPFLDPGPQGVGAKVYALLGNESRSSIVRFCLEYELDSQAKELGEVLLRHYDICRENRNLVAHSIYFRDPVKGDAKLLKHQRGKWDPQSLNIFDVDEQAMLQIADECLTTYDFGVALYMKVDFLLRFMTGRMAIHGSQKFEEPPWPDKPAQPLRLVPNPRPTRGNDQGQA